MTRSLAPAVLAAALFVVPSTGAFAQEDPPESTTTTTEAPPETTTTTEATPDSTTTTTAPPAGDGSVGVSIDGLRFDLAELLAASFSTVGVEEIRALFESGIGYGAAFKLMVYSEAAGVPLGDLVGPDDGGNGFGNLLRELDPALFDSLPKNLGQVIAAANRPAHAGPKHDANGDVDDGGEDSGTTTTTTVEGEPKNSGAGLGQGKGNGNAFGKDKGKANGKGKKGG